MMDRVAPRERRWKHEVQARLPRARPAGGRCARRSSSRARGSRSRPSWPSRSTSTRESSGRRYRYHSPLVSAEWCALTNTPWGRGLINFSAEEEALALETYRTWVRLFELQRYYSWIVDRFHVSTIVYQRRANGRAPDFGWLEARLAALGFQVVFCTRRPDSFAAARAERLKVSGNPGQYDDLEVLIREQEDFRAVLRHARLPVLEVDMSEGDVVAAAERVADWLEETGGLWAT